MILRQTHIVPAQVGEVRLYDYIPDIFTDIPSRSAIKKSITQGKILVDGEKSQTGMWVKEGQKIDWVDLQESPPKPIL